MGTARKSHLSLLPLFSNSFLVADESLISTLMKFVNNSENVRKSEGLKLKCSVKEIIFLSFLNRFCWCTAFSLFCQDVQSHGQFNFLLRMLTCLKIIFTLFSFIASGRSACLDPDQNGSVIFRTGGIRYNLSAIGLVPFRIYNPPTFISWSFF